MQSNITNTLREYGLKVTPQRVTILDSIDKRGHANIDEIYQDVKKLHSSISLATVYKNITSLVEKKLLKELALNNLKSKYEISKEAHSHLICKVCNSVEDIEISQNIDRDFGEFKVEDIELNLYGICKKCQ